MPAFNAYPYSLTQTVPPQKIGAGLAGGKVRTERARVDLATINGGSAVTTSDTIVLFDLPVGAIVLGPMTVCSSVSLTTSTLAMGITGNTDKYGSMTYGTTANAVVNTWRPAEADFTAPLTATETVFVTIGSANLPTSGIVEFQLQYVTE
jgi:hypothetical protein